MADSTIRARPPAGDPDALHATVDPDQLALRVTDAAHVPGGRATALTLPASEAAVAAVLRAATRVLPIGAQSSLTGGATPMGDVLLSTARLTAIEDDAPGCVRVGPGLTLAALDAALAAAGRMYPPAPTFTGATIGGTIATNAAGAATFKYGTTRDWIVALTVVLPSGDVLDLERGACIAHPDGYFDVELGRGRVRVPVPSYGMPDVPKLSAGYFARPSMDLVDLFVGSEGTLGVVTSATLRVLPIRPAVCLALVFVPDTSRALELARRLREGAERFRQTSGREGLDVAAIEYMDRRSLALVRADPGSGPGAARIPDDAGAALLAALELDPTTTAADAFEQMGRALDADAPDTPLVRFCTLLAREQVLDDVDVAVPGDAAAAARLSALREAVPAAVNAHVGRAQAAVDPRIEKTAGDLLVPFDRLAAFLGTCAEEFERRGLDAAIWGHISDGNVHPNVIPRSLADVEAGRAAVLALGRQAVRIGGTPLAEHGVGRSRVKQQLLRELYGQQGVEAMRAVKRTLDPEWKLAPGVLFPGP